MPSVRFFTEDISFKLPAPQHTRNWIKRAIKSEGFHPGDINYIFCSDSYLHQINLQYLNHDTYTDIVTFDSSEETGVISGDIFVSVERIRENAKSLKVKTDDELHRVIIHGVLHLAGYRDKKKNERALMREREDAYLALRKRST